jgi:rubrerythrin
MNLKILAASFAVVFLAELGDKTQLTALAFSAQTRSQWSVFLGTSLALICTTALAVACGGLLAKVLPPRVMHLSSGVMFVLIGLILLVNLARKAPSEAEEAVPEEERVESAMRTGPVGAFVARQVISFEEDLASFVDEQAQGLPEGNVRDSLLAAARAHRGHVRSLRGLGEAIGDEERLAIDRNLERMDAGRLLSILEESDTTAGHDAVSRIIERQEAAAQFYIALAQMIGFHDARDVLRHLAAEEIRMAQDLCSLTQHAGDATA